MGENEYKIQLGVKLDTSDIASQINAYESKIDPIKIKIDVETKELVKQIQSGLKSLTSGTKNALTLDTSKIEASFKDVASTIKDIKASIGTLDSGAGMKSLLSSINQISGALEKASSQFVELNASLNSLASKDFSVNLGINMGGSNPIGRNAAYGSKVRNETIPQLKQQMNDLVKYYNTTYKESLNEFEALQKLVSGTKLNNGDFFETFLFGKDSVATRMSGGSLSGQMQAYKQYIDMFKQAASLKGLDISSVTSSFSKSADDLVKDAQDIQTGAKEAQDGFEKLKQVFSGGGDLNLEGLSAQLEPIVQDLNAIRQAVESLSSGVSVDGLTQSFDRLSETLEKLTTNFTLVQNSLGTGISSAGTSVGSSVAQDFKEVDIAISSSEDQINNLKSALNKVGFNDSSIENITNEFKELGVTVTNVTSRLNDDGSVKLTVKGLDQAKNEIIKIKEIGKDGLVIGGSTTISKESKEIESNFAKLKSIAQDMGKLEIDIFKSDDTAEITRMSVELDKLYNEYKELYAQTSSGLSSKQDAQLSDTFKKNEEALSKLKKSYAEARAELAKNIKSNIGTSIDKDIQKAHSDFNKLSIQTDELKQKLNELDNIKIDLDTAKEENDVEALIAAHEEYKRVLKEVQAQIDMQKRAEQDYYGVGNLETAKQNALLRLKNLFGDNSEAARKFASEVERIQNELNECGNIAGVNQLNKQITNLGLKVKETGARTQTFGQSLKKQFAQYSSYFSVASLFMYAEQGLRSMFEQVKLIDSAMTELKKVTDETDTSYNQFLSNAASRAKELGTTIDGLVSSTADFARLGYGFEESQGLAEVANIYAVVGDEIDGVEGATQSLVSTMAAFKDEMNGMSDSDFALGIVDKMNEVSNNFAISSGGIGEALQRSASSMATANNTLDETISLITAANEVVQNPEKVGNAFKTISMRIRGAKTELEDAGESTDGMVESTATLREEVMALSGVDIMLNENTFKSTYQVLDELSAKWEGLSDIAQASLVELMAGKHQGNVFSSIMANFDTARDALETSLTSSGSAMEEHGKWSESLEARLNKLKAAWQSLSQTFMNSDFLKGAIDVLINIVDILDKLINKIGALPTIIGIFAGGKAINKILDAKKMTNLVGGISSMGDALSVLGNAFPNAAKGVGIFTNALANGTKGFGLMKAAASGLWTVISAHPILAAAGAIAALVVITDKYTESAKELAQRVEEVTSKYKEQHTELMNLKGDYDTASEDSMISKYGELSRGVNALGENVSLTTDEYSEYKSIVDTIANQIPSLVTGYNSQGNAILGCAGNVDKLREAYEKLIITQNDEVLDTGKDIFKDFQNDMKKSSLYYSTTTTDDYGLTEVFEHYDTKHFEELQNLMNLNDEELESAVNSLSSEQVTRISDLLDEYGIERDLLGSGEKGWETWQEHIIRAVNTNKEEVKDVLTEASEDINTYAEDLGTVTDAYFSNAFLGDYSHMSDRMQAIINQVASSFDSEFYAQFLDDEKYATSEAKYKALTEYYDSILDSFNNNIDTFEAAFDLQTQFNGGEISYGEYVDALKEAGKLIDGLGLNEDIANQIKLSLGINEEGLVEEYESLLNRLTETSKDKIATGNVIGLSSVDAEDLLDSLSSEELSIMTQIIPKIDANATKKEIQAVIDREMVIRGLSFDLNFNVEAAGIESINTALAESVSATGLSSESISALKSRYADLESQGYDLSSMFEETSNGIHLNRKEFNKLEKAYSTKKLDAIDSDLTEMKSTYDSLGDAIKNCTDPVEKSKLFSDRQLLAERISEAATLASQYEGLTSAYNDWLNAEEAGQERDMYENIISGFETVDDEISRGWLDDGTIKFLELLTGRTDLATKSAKELKKIYKNLNKDIKYKDANGKVIENTGYSVRDFFTVDEDGNSTNTGVYNFLDAIGKLEEEAFGGSDVVKRDKGGNIIGFDFEVAGGDEAIAEALGVSKELVQIMVRAADDAGFVISLDGTYKQLADMQNEAKAATDYLNNLFNKDYSFDFNTSDLKSLNADLTEAKKILEKEEFWNTDGTFNFDADGATEAMTIVSTLQARIDSLTSEKYGIGLTVEEEEFKEPLENLQNYGKKVATLNQLELNPKANAEEIEKINGELNEIAEYFAGLDEETKIELGFKADDDIQEIKNKIESGEVTIPTVLDIQANMDKNIERLADLAWLNSGLLSESEEETIRKKYKIEIEADEVDTSDVDKKVDNAISEDNNSGITEKNIEIVAEIFGTDGVEDLSKKINGLDDKTIETAVSVLGRVDVEKLKTAIDGLDDEIIQIIAKALGQGNVALLADTIENLDDKSVKAIAEAFGYDNVKDLKVAIRSLDDKTVKAVAEVFGITDVDSLKGAIDKLDSKTVKAIAEVVGKSGVDGLKSAIDKLKDKTVNITTNIIKNLSTAGEKASNKRTGKNLKVGEVNGTANLNGSTFVNGKSGKAFKQGDWRTKKSETALTGELGREIVVTPENRWYTVGDNGAEFVNIPRGSIVFNHIQTEELLNNGKATSGGGRGRALVGGTAYAMLNREGGSSGLVGIGKVVENAVKKAVEKNDKKAAGGSGGTGGGVGKAKGKAVGSDKKKKNSGGSSSSSASKDDFEETLDWIEIAISRIERAIDNLDRKANNVYESWSSRNKALTSEIGKVRDEIELQEDAAQRYLDEANSVGLSSAWKKKVQNGKVDISTIKDEALAEKIKQYQEWYEKYLDCIDAADELKEREAALYKQRFDNILTRYDGMLSVIEHEKNMLEEHIAQSEARGRITSAEYYKALIDNENKNISKLEAERDELIKARDEAVASGAIKVGSEAWYELTNEIDGVTLSIEKARTATIEYNNAIRDIEWKTFDLLQDKISQVAEESNFLIDLLSNEKLYDDNGKLTDEGNAVMGLHGQNYNTYMAQADKYAEEIARLDKEIAKDPYNQDLINRRQELVKAQQDSILAAEEERQAIVDMVEEGINLELDALQERIDKYNESIEAQKDLYDYQKKVKEQTEEIASLEKQIAAYRGNDSEEARAKVQELEMSLEEAKENLQETEYEKYISDQQKLLDELYLEYETILNTRLDNVDALISDAITQINASASSISTTISEKAESVGYSLSDSMKTIWSNNAGSINGVITTYGDKFSAAQTTTNNALNIINTNLQSMITQLNKIAKTNVKSASTSSSANTTESKKTDKKTETTKKDTTKTQTTSAIKVGGKINAKGAQIYDYVGDTSGSRQLYRNDPIYTVLSEKNGYLKVRYHKLSSGVTGWFKKSDVKAYASGKENILNDEIAWTQEGRKQEFIVRPSDGAILTPIAKGDSVLNAAASGNIWSMANNPSEFIKDNLRLDTSNIPNVSSVQSNYTQHLDKVVFNLPNVKNYDELLAQMQKDKSFEKLIMAMTVDRIVGKSSLAKGKSIR